MLHPPKPFIFGMMGGAGLKMVVQHCSFYGSSPIHEFGGGGETVGLALEEVAT